MNDEAKASPSPATRLKVTATRSPGEMKRRCARVVQAPVLVGLLVLCVPACTGSDGRSPRAWTLRDSAGIRIVTHVSAPSMDTIPLEPALSIGAEGDPDYEFFRVGQVSPLGSGNIVVANGGTSELMFYSPEGEFLRRVGRTGEGPSEFGFLATVHVRGGDTLTVVDPRRRRLVHFDSSGTFVRGESFAQDLTSASPTSMCVVPGLMGLLADGTRLTTGWGCMEFTGSDGIRPTTTTLVLARGERRDTIGTLNTINVWERGSGTGPDAFDLLPFSHVVSWATGPGSVYLSGGVDYSILVYDSVGALRQIVREEGLAPGVTREDRGLYREEQVARGRPHPDDVPFPERFGAYSRLLVSHEGDLWARWAERPSEEMVRWTVYSADGQTIRRLVLPKIEVHAVRDGRIYGHTEDDVGIQTILVLNDGGR